MPEAAPSASPTFSLAVLPGAMLRVHAGANLGDGVSFAADLSLDDVYRLHGPGVPLPLSLRCDGGPFVIDADSEAGTPGARVALDSVLTFMSPDGATTDALLLVELDAGGFAAQSHVMPLAPLTPRVDYALVTVDSKRPLEWLAQLACVSFSRGTHITLSSGAQVPVEELAVGDRVLTRDAGAQAVRWIGRTTLRAAGAFAPVCIRAGALNNSRDLLVCPDHRLFIYQRHDHLGAGRPEVLVKARHLVNGDTITVRAGGYVDYFQLLFDSHQIIYAEGIAAESFLIDPRTAPALPYGAPLTPHDDRYNALDVQERLLARPNVADLLRRASRR